MSETYFIDCDCGNQLRVELFDAGTIKMCPSCGATVKVPSSNKLKELSGDKYPFLRPIEKVRRTVQMGEPPFHGMCHRCCTVRAAYATPCTFTVMAERHVADEGGIRPSMTGGVKFVVGASEEKWETTTFPLLLCEQCQSQFHSDRLFARVNAGLKLVALLGLLVVFLYFAYHNAEVVAALSGIIWLIGVIAWAARFRNTKKLDPFVTKWLQNIRWVPDAIAGEDEFRLTIGASTGIKAS